MAAIKQQIELAQLNTKMDFVVEGFKDQRTDIKHIKSRLESGTGKITANSERITAINKASRVQRGNLFKVFGLVFAILTLLGGLHLT